MIDEENKSATMTEAPAAATAAPAHAAPAGSAPVEPEDTVFSLPLSHVTHDISDLADNEDEEDAVAAPIGAHAAEQPTAPEATPAPAHFAEPVAAAINESAAVFAAPEPAAPAFPIAPASEVAPASTPAPDPIDVSPQDDESTARVSEEPGSPDTGDSESNAETDTVSPGDTAEIDVAAVEAKLKDPGSTMSFEPLTEERIGAMARGILETAALPDPVGRVLKRVERPNGLVIEKTAALLRMRRHGWSRCRRGSLFHRR